MIMSTKPDVTITAGLDASDVSKDIKKVSKEVRTTAYNLRGDVNKALDGIDSKTASSRMLQIKASLEKATKESDKLRTELTELTRVKVQTAPFKAVTEELAKANREVSDAIRMRNELRNLGVSTTSQRYRTAELRVERKKAARDEILSRRTSLAMNEKAYIAGTETADFRQKTEALEAYNNQITIGIRKLEELAQKQAKVNTDNGFKSESQEATQTTGALAQLDTQKKKTTKSNAELGSEAFNTQVKMEGERLSATKLASSLKTIGNVAKGVAKLFSPVVRGAKLLINRLRGVNTQTQDTSKSMKNLLKFALKYGLGLRSIFILYKRLRSAGVEAYKGLASQFPELQREVNDLKNSFFQLKNSLATMAQPIFSYLVPAIKTLMSWLSAAMTAIANFFAILTGAKYIYKATNANKDWAKSAAGAGKAAKEANEDIAEYDNLILIQQDKDGGGGGGGAVDDYAGAFEKVKAESDLARELREAIDAGDWYGVGSTLMKRLNDVTLRLDNWINNEFRPKAKYWAKNIGQILNGFTDTWDSALTGKTLSDALMAIYDTIATFYETYNFKTLGEKVGTAITTFFTNWEPETVARRISGKFNAVINFVAGFIKKTDFKLIGKTLGESLKKTIEKIQWKDLGADLSGLATGLLEGLSSFIRSSKVGQTVGKAITEFLKGIDFARLATDISELAINLLDALADVIETIDWTVVGQAIADFLKNIDWMRFIQTLVKLAWNIIKALGEALWQIVTDPEALLSLATPLVAIFGAKWIWNKVKTAIAGGIGSALSGGVASSGLGASLSGALNTALGKVLVGVGTYEIAGKIGANIAKSIFAGSDEVLAKEYDKFAEKPIQYTITALKETLSSAFEGSTLTGGDTSILGNALMDMFTGGDYLEKELQAFHDKQQAIRDAEFEKYLDMLQRRYQANREITDADIELLKEYGRIADETTAKYETDSNHYADIAKKNAGVVSDAQKQAEESSNHYAEIAQENAKKHVNSAAVMEQASNHHAAIAKANAGVQSETYKAMEASSTHYADIAKSNAKSVEERSTEMVTNIEGTVATIPDNFDTTFSSAYDKMTSSFDATTTYFGNVAEGVKTPFESMADFFKTTFSNSWNGVVDVFKSNSPEFQSIQDSVSGVFRGSINSMITGINNTLAAPFSTLASVFSKMRNMEVGGAKIFSALPSFMVPKIPKLAQGAVLPPNSPFLAVVGDQKQGTNVETPLATMVEAFKLAMAESGGNNNQPIVLNINGRQVAQAVWDEENKRYKQTGVRYKTS